VNKSEQIALAKCRYNKEYKYWVAQVTPDQALYLIKLGAKADCSFWTEKRLEEHKKEGLSGLIWFYFMPNKELKQKLLTC
jgi:hypothetical protein